MSRLQKNSSKLKHSRDLLSTFQTSTRFSKWSSFKVSRLVLHNQSHINGHDKAQCDVSGIDSLQVSEDKGTFPLAKQGWKDCSTILWVELLRKMRVCPAVCCQMTRTALVFITMMLTGLAMLNSFSTTWILPCWIVRFLKGYKEDLHRYNLGHVYHKKNMLNSVTRKCKWIYWSLQWVRISLCDLQVPKIFSTERSWKKLLKPR